MNINLRDVNAIPSIALQSHNDPALNSGIPVQVRDVVHHQHVYIIVAPEGEGGISRALSHLSTVGDSDQQQPRTNGNSYSQVWSASLSLFQKFLGQVRGALTSLFSDNAVRTEPYEPLSEDC